MIKKTFITLTLTLCSFANIAQAQEPCSSRLKLCMGGNETGEPYCAAYLSGGLGVSLGQQLCTTRYNETKDKKLACDFGCMTNLVQEKACTGECK